MLAASYFRPGSLFQSGRMMCFTGQGSNYRPVSPSGEPWWTFDQGCKAADWPKEGRREGKDKGKRVRGGGVAVGLSRPLIVVQV